MKKIQRFYICFLAFGCAIILCSFVRNLQAKEQLVLPYKQAGLTVQQAAAHLLSRFTYGAKTGDVDKVVKLGLEKWITQQLDGNLEDKDLESKLSEYDAINLSNTEVENLYPRNAQVVKYALRDSAVHKDSVNGNTKTYRDALAFYMKEKGYRPQQDLYRQFINQKIVRAAYTNNQFRELMTDFWFNHFNVALSKNQCAAYIPAYERDVIRPNVFGMFENLVLNTAKSPAMLMYLDNFTSSGTNDPSNQPINRVMIGDRMAANPKSTKAQNEIEKNQVNKPKNAKAGLNENYAREVMELHTLGVDGGYTQSDVTQAARILTGWTLAPMGNDGYGAPMKKLMERVGEGNLTKRGFVHEGDFLFVPNRHDNGEKTVLGRKFVAGGGYEEGVELLKMLAQHKSAAKFISSKIATRFVSDHPPQSLVAKMTKTFLNTDGDIKEVLITMISAPEFWSKNALREKTKSPFELAISAVRSLDAKISQPYQLYTWINKMGQQMYNYQAPTGFPDRGQYWINTGSLLNRMNFGLALATQKIPGITFSLIALNNNHEPESAEAALHVYSKLLMPERKLDATIARLKPILTDPNLENKVSQMAAENTPSIPKKNEDSNMMDGKGKKPSPELVNNKSVQKTGANTMLAQVVGVIIGSPEFQRK